LEKIREFVKGSEVKMFDEVNIEELEKLEREKEKNPTPKLLWECKRCGNIYNPILPFKCDCGNKSFELKDIESAVQYFIKNKDSPEEYVKQFFLLDIKPTLTEILVRVAKSESNFYTTKFDDRNEIYFYLDGIYIPEGRTFIKEIARRYAGKYYTENLGNLIIAKIEADTFIEQNKLFKPQNIEEICVLNGVLNLKTKELLPYNKDKIFFSKIQANFDLTKTCENINLFLLEVLPEQKDILTIYEIVGFCLFREYFIEKGVMMLGSGRNGKGKTITLIKSLLGEQNFTGLPLQKLESGDFKEIELMGKLANLGGDISNYPLKDTSKFKGLTGRDTITASKKFKNDVSFVNHAKMIFATNVLPKTYDLSEGFFSRWVYLNFPFTFKPKKEYDELVNIDCKLVSSLKILDPHRIDLIMTSDEMSGFLNEAIRGLHRLWSNNDFTSSSSSEDTKAWWIRNSDSFLAFTLENLEIADSELEFIKKDSLRKCYQAYCKKHRLPPEGDKHIYEIMIRQVKAWDSQLNEDERERVWKGVRFKQIYSAQGTHLF
jgi:putative DNA primase/helicase